MQNPIREDSAIESQLPSSTKTALEVEIRSEGLQQAALKEVAFLGVFLSDHEHLGIFKI